MDERTEAKRTRLARRQKRIRTKIRSTADRPRLCVVRTLRHMYAQIVDDDSGTTLVAASTLSPELKTNLSRTWNKDAAQALGRLIAEKAKAKGISAVVFERSGRKFHGRVKALAEAAREGGLVF